ncbi:uncharacterized protein LOC110816909 [Carica papaya]|uniref:uncharacterized protein LOC110816909 n=1 Tax=Carica papaya TaxID=3649 RepID=UPI000B8D1B45|nr:uncharacterized protein LOC110816909 [Carica papaya]
MSSRSRAWTGAGSCGAVEAMKGQGFYRWNSSFWSNYKLSSSSSAAMVSSQVREEEKVKNSEDTLRTVMYLSCWGPN